jgi:Zn-dependent M32 family carboxypeptidase
LLKIYKAQATYQWNNCKKKSEFNNFEQHLKGLLNIPPPKKAIERK